MEHNRLRPVRRTVRLVGFILLQKVLRARRIPFMLFTYREPPFIRDMLEVVARRERFPLVDLQREMDPRWVGQDERLFHNSVTDNHPSLLGNRPWQC